MKWEDITVKNVKAFIEGNSKLLGSKFGLVDTHIREQVAWRAEICKDSCLPAGKCEKCGCAVPGKLYVKKSCNDGEKFPDLMDKEEWEQYKLDNDIKL